jgi:hypothetical protein
MSVVVYPEPRQPALLDPIRDAGRFSASYEIPEQWDPDHTPFQFFSLLPTLDSLRAQLPPSDERSPAYLVALARNGVMEYGTTLESGLRRDIAAENRIIFTASHTYQAHDYLQAFGLALQDLGYEGTVAAQVSFENTSGVTVAIARDRWVPNIHPIEVASVRGHMWRGPAADLVASAGRITKDVMDRVFLAAGVTTGIWLIDSEGRLSAN